MPLVHLNLSLSRDLSASYFGFGLGFCFLLWGVAFPILEIELKAVCEAGAPPLSAAPWDGIIT